MKKFTVVLLLLLFLSGCRGGGGGSSSTSEDIESNGTSTQTKVTISFWNLFTGPDGSVMKKMVNDFNKEFENRIFVTDQSTPEVEYYANLDTLVPMNKGPDLAIAHSYRVPSMANRNLIIPIDELFESSEMKKEDYIPDIFNSLYFKDKLYGVPLDIHTVGIYYNRDLLDKYECEVPTNREELIACAKKMPNDDNGGYGLPLSAVWPSEWIYTTAFFQNQGVEIDENHYPGFDSPAGRIAFESFTDLIHVHKLSPLNLGVDEDLFYFHTGKAMFHINGGWMINSMIEAELNFGVIPLSNMFNADGKDYSRKISARSHVFIVPKGKQSQAKLDAIMTFIKYIGDHSYIWASAGHIPVSNIAREAEEYKQLPYHAGFGDPNDFKVATQSPYYTESYNPIYLRVTQALRNPNYDVDALIASAKQEATQLVNEAKATYPID